MPVASVYRARIGSTGSLGAWQPLVSLPSRRSYFGLGQFGGYLYAFGGDSGTTNHDAEAYMLGSQFQTYTMDNSRGAAWPSYRSDAVSATTRNNSLDSLVTPSRSIAGRSLEFEMVF